MCPDISRQETGGRVATERRAEEKGMPGVGGRSRSHAGPRDRLAERRCRVGRHYGERGIMRTRGPNHGKGISEFEGVNAENESKQVD